MTQTNFKELWQSQPTQPGLGANAIAAKARDIKHKSLLRIVLSNALLLATMVLIIWVVVYYDPKMPTTKIGALLVVIGLVMQIIASSKLIPLLKKNNANQNNAEYLQQLLVLKNKQFFLETTIMSLYFLLLGIGIGLYMIEYAMMLAPLYGFLYCGLTALWMAFAWFYLRPRTINKHRRKLNDLIAQLEKLESQFNENNP